MIWLEGLKLLLVLLVMGKFKLLLIGLFSDLYFVRILFLMVFVLVVGLKKILLLMKFWVILFLLIGYCLFFLVFSGFVVLFVVC